MAEHEGTLQSAMKAVEKSVYGAEDLSLNCAQGIQDALEALKEKREGLTQQRRELDDQIREVDECANAFLRAFELLPSRRNSYAGRRPANSGNGQSQDKKLAEGAAGAS